jgi:acyl-CoA synthetase (AMP-forming)/AMP-acid ligase II/acyl carrier protein
VTLRWYTDVFQLGTGDRVAMLGGLGHDPLLRDILAVLLAAGTLVVPPQDIFTAPAALFRLLREQRITVLNATPALLELILAGRPRHASGEQELGELRLVVSGGAPLTAGLVRALRGVTPARVVNAYGTTETPQIASCQEVAAYRGPVLAGALPDAAVLPVGAGVAGARLMVLRPDGSPARVGQVGEVVVRSPHLAAGYLGNERYGGFDRTPGAYHTGDRGRWDLFGSVVLDGRLDRQVTVDGHRLDPEQVERAALRHPAIRQALVRPRETPAGPVLTLWAVPAPGSAVPAVAELRAHLRAYLPRYAVPAEITLASELVIGGHHKVVGARPIARPAAPRQPADGTLDELTALVREVIGTDVAPTENFFEAGLSSVTLVRLHAVLNERLATDLPVTAMFEYPNLAALARFVATGAPERPAALVTAAGRTPGDGHAERRRQMRQRIHHELGGGHEPVRQG